MLRLCNNLGLLGFVFDVEFGESPDDLATREDKWRAAGTEGPHSLSLVIEAD